MRTLTLVGQVLLNGEVHCVLHMYDKTFDEFRKTLHGEDGRYIDTEPKEKLQLLFG